MKEDQIVEAARKLFHKYGYKRVSMDEIASAANVTKRTVYSYFSSKEELLKFFINEEVKNMKNIVIETENKELSFFENVHNVICSLLKYKKEKNFLQIILEESEAFKNPVVTECIKEIDKMIQNYIKENLIYAQEKKYIKDVDVEVVAFCIYKMYLAMMIEIDEMNFDEKRMADSIIGILKSGLERRED